MRVRVLGSAAGGGFPQWNCNCPNCRGLRAGTLEARPRTQSSIAVSGDGEAWVLFNASPDIRQQLGSFAALQPGRALRDTAICGVVLVDAQIDHTAGLLILREGRPLDIYCTDPVYEDLTTGNPVLKLLEHYCGVNRVPIPLGPEASFRVEGAEGLRFTALSLDSKPPPFSPRRNAPSPGDNIGIQVEDERSGGILFYAPGLGRMSPELCRRMAASDCVLVDGTFWTEDEMIRLGAGHKRAADMGHLPQSGEGGMLQLLRPMKDTRKVLIHINNTNPILNEASKERAELEAAGVEVAYDGMEIEL
jgi:pyrroloquinoline quinone biosynthesis protein B